MVEAAKYDHTRLATVYGKLTALFFEAGSCEVKNYDFSAVRADKQGRLTQ